MQARTEEYARLLRRFSRAELEEAYTDVLQTWDKPTWPPPGAFFSAAMQNRKAHHVPEHTPIERIPGKRLDLPHERVMAILDDTGPESEELRAALYRLGTGGAEPPMDVVGDSLRMK